MTVHVLHAGDGYTYLTRQVASHDVPRTGRDPLVDYYQSPGNRPGEWAGSGCADLGVSGVVSEDQMQALFGEGLRPDAAEFIAERVQAGVQFSAARDAARLGRKFYSYANAIPFAADVQDAYGEFEKRHHRRPSVQERRSIKHRVARDALAAAGQPVSAEAVQSYIADQLGRVRFPVSGFDLVFSPVKSVSVLWALGGHRIRRVVERVHQDAWRGALAYGEQVAAFTRAGVNGVAFLATSGFVATAFEHRDSRAGDPDLHTHVAVANRVLGEDGKWRTLDSRQLHQAAVSMSERYNSLIEQGMVEALGVWFVDGVAPLGKRVVREIDGIPVEWLKGFSQRRAQVETGYEELVRQYVSDHGKSPPRSVQHKLAQQATLEGRPAKTRLRTLSEQVDDWEERAGDMRPDVNIRATITACTRRPVELTPRTRLLDVAAAVVARVGEERATWTALHARPEAERQLRPEWFASATERINAVEDVTRLALDLHSVQLDVAATNVVLEHDAGDHQTTSSATSTNTSAAGDTSCASSVASSSARSTSSASDTTSRTASAASQLAAAAARLAAVGGETPALLRSRDGRSVFRRHESEVYTSEAILSAESRLLSDTRVRRGAALSAAKRNRELRQWERSTRRRPGGKRVVLDPGQRALVEHFVSCGAAVGIGPPGAGKSTAMAAVRAVWQSTGGRVVGLAPSAVAAAVLSTELGVRANTIHSFVDAYRNGDPVDLRRGDMLLVDEAGMAGTLQLDQVRAAAAEFGAIVRLVGDYRQLCAVEAGGALRLLHTDAGGVELTRLHRFALPEEADAVLKVRVGDESAVKFYKTNGRLIGGVGPAVLDRLYSDWKNDRAAGRVSIMMSDTTEVARDLSLRAQAELRAAGHVAATGIQLGDGATAGVGDQVVTRFNKRGFRLNHHRDFVKNGDVWRVLETLDDGRLRVRHLRHGGSIVLPAWYVEQYVELGYAATVHRSQGLTVDIGRAYLSPGAVREALLVAMSRGRLGNYAYLDIEEILDPDEPETLPDDLYYRHRDTTTAAAAFVEILRREGAELSATEQLRDALEAPFRLSTVVPRYLHGLHVHRGDQAERLAEQWVRQAMPEHADDIINDPAWPQLQEVLHEVRTNDADPITVLVDRAEERELTTDDNDPARSVAQVMHYRIVTTMPDPPADGFRPELLPGWIPSPPGPGGSTYLDDGRDPRAVAELDTWLRARTGQIADRVHELGERALQNEPNWTKAIGEIPTDPIGQEQWIRNAGHVAAYREHWQIPETDPDLLPGSTGGVQGRARRWILDYLAANRPRLAARRAAQAAERAKQQQAKTRQDWRDDAEREAERRRERAHAQRVRRERRASAAALLRSTWRHEPHLVERIISGHSFD